jgi:AraC-like DNA-binding protein
MLRSTFGSTSIDEAEFDYTFRCAMTPPDKIMLARVHAGAMELDSAHGPSEVFGPGRVGAIGMLDGEPFTGTCHRGRWDTVLIDNTFLGQVTANRGDREVRLTGSTAVSEAANRHLAAAIDYVRDSIAADPEAARSPLIAGAAQRHLAACILATYPNTAQPAGEPHGGRDTTDALLRKAVGYIEDNAHRDISLQNIADAIHVTPRAVQYMFRRHKDRTPMQFLREIRLHYAHLDLVAGDQYKTSVRNVANRWGFAHLGRFAASYRLIYGHSPHVTLRD